MGAKAGGVAGAAEKLGSPIMLRRFGWAFLLAWVFCVFYTEAVEGYTGNRWAELGLGGSGAQVFFSGLPVFASIAMLVAIVCLEKQLGSPVAHPSLYWLAPFATAISTPLLFWGTGEAVSTIALFVLGALLTGVGSGFMWVMWGEYYAKVSQAEVELLAPVSAIVAAVLVLVVSSMSGWVSVALVTSFPLLSGLSLALSWRDVQAHDASAEHHGLEEQRAFRNAHDRAKDSPLKALASMGRIGLGILVACLFVCLEGTFWEASARSMLPFQLVLLASIVLMAVVAVASTMGPRRVSLSFLYRWMCPLLVAGFAALIAFDGGLGGYLAYGVAIAARFGFCLITQMCFARFAAMGKTTAVQSFGLGWIFVHLGDFLGILLYVAVGSWLDAGLFTTAQVAAMSITALVVVTMFVLNDERGFSLDPAAQAVAPSTGGEACQADAAGATEPDALGEPIAGQGATAPTAGGAGMPADASLDQLGLRIRSLAREHELTPREIEVFDLLARGRSIPYVRDALFISKETAATHAKHVYAKLGVHSRQELIDLVH